jgi:hypothetical protein
VNVRCHWPLVFRSDSQSGWSFGIGLLFCHIGGLSFFVLCFSLCYNLWLWVILNCMLNINKQFCVTWCKNSAGYEVKQVCWWCANVSSVCTTETPLLWKRWWFVQRLTVCLTVTFMCLAVAIKWCYWCTVTDCGGLSGHLKLLIWMTQVSDSM